jgi:hypothetical protein
VLRGSESVSPSSVDEDSFLHTESDPRYRGAAIPSRAFRLLQNMTDGSADYSEQGMVLCLHFLHMLAGSLRKSIYANSQSFIC